MDVRGASSFVKEGMVCVDTLVDLVVISFNTRQMVLDCLHSIRANTPEPHHIILVDNGSRDGTVEAVRQLGWQDMSIVANAGNVGYAKACNQGIYASRSPYIVLLNSDVVLTPGWLRPLIECIQGDERIAVVGPKMVDRAGRITGAGIVGTNAQHYPRGLLEPDRSGMYDEQEDCISVSGAAYLIRRDLLATLGMFDEHYFFYFEETDYSFQARSQGFRVVYCPRSKIYHMMGRSCQDHAYLRALFERSERHFRRKWAHVMTEGNA